MKIKIALISSPVTYWSKIEKLLIWRDKMRAAAMAEPNVVGY